MTATHFATTGSDEAGFVPDEFASDESTSNDTVGNHVMGEATIGRRFDQLVEELRGASRRDVGSRTKGPRRPNATRRGPVAVPVQRRAERPVVRSTGVAGPRLATDPVRRAVRHDQRVRCPQAARVARPAVTASTWRLTDRGIAVVMAIGAVLMVAAVVAVVTTAVTVTSEDYRPAAGVEQHA